MTTQPTENITINDNAVQDGQTIDAADVTIAFDDVQTELQNGWVRVSSNDSNVKHLEDGITGSSGITVSTINDGADESLNITVDDSVVATASNTITLSSKTLTSPTIADFSNANHNHQDSSGGGQLSAAAIDSETATSGYVLTADGSGNSSWAAVGGGGAQPVDLNATAGETLSERDFVYLDESSGTWLKLDVDATGEIKCDSLRGCVNESGGIASASSGSVRILGEVSGFSGLTAWGRVYAGTTAGAYSQIKPAVTDGGGQVAIAQMGYAVSSTIIFIQPSPVIYAKRGTLSDTATMTIEHHSDAKTRQRQPRAYIGTTVPGSTLTEYTSGNQDDNFTIQGFTGAGGTLDINGSGQSSPIGDVSGTERATAQQFTPSASGQLSQIKVTLAANTNSPTNLIIWRVYADNGTDLPDGTHIENGNFSPTGAGEYTLDITNGPLLDSSQKYWLYLYAYAVDLPDNNRYNWQRASTDVYPSHKSIVGDEGADFSTFTPLANDCEFEVTTSAVSTYDEIAQSFQISSTADIATVDLYLKKIGSPTGTLTLEIHPDSTGAPSGSAVTNGVSDTVSASTLTSSFASTEFSFSTPPTLTSGTTYWLVLKTTDTQSQTNYIAWGSDTSTPSYSDGELLGNISSAWSSLSADGIFAVNSDSTQYDEPCVVGRWSGGTRDVAVRFDDGTGYNPTTRTTFKNVTGSTLDIITEIEVV